MSHRQVQKYIEKMTKLKFLRGQPVYLEGKEANSVYIIFKGEFEQQKRLPQPISAFKIQ
jgi:CRP-like cAMP-binding protein